MAINSPIAANSRLPLLDGLRGLAAVVVMIFHLQCLRGTGGFLPMPKGYLLVDFFFLLSGFVLTLASEDKMNAGWGVSGFMRARIRRFWPTIIIADILGALVMLASGETEGLALILLLNILFIPKFYPDGANYPVNGPQWTLTYELFANLIHGLLLRRLSDRSLLIFALMSGSLVAWHVLTFGSTFQIDYSERTHQVPRVLWSYSMGIWLCRKWRQGWFKPMVSWQTALAFPVLVMIALPLSPFGEGPSEAATILIVFPLALCMAVSVPPSTQAIPWLSRLGGISYPLYALHMPVLKAFEPYMVNSPLIGFVAVLVTLLVSYLVGIITAPQSAPRATRHQPYPA